VRRVAGAKSSVSVLESGARTVRELAERAHTGGADRRVEANPERVDVAHYRSPFIFVRSRGTSSYRSPTVEMTSRGCRPSDAVISARTRHSMRARGLRRRAARRGGSWLASRGACRLGGSGPARTRPAWLRTIACGLELRGPPAPVVPAMRSRPRTHGTRGSPSRRPPSGSSRTAAGAMPPGAHSQLGIWSSLVAPWRRHPGDSAAKPDSSQAAPVKLPLGPPRLWAGTGDHADVRLRPTTAPLAVAGCDHHARQRRDARIGASRLS
jgi:hypothetical protein